jgi:hypothetical protein
VSSDPTGASAGPGGGGPGAPGQPSEEELRAAYEAELSRITTADMMLQAAVSLLNIGSYRLAPRPPAAAGGPVGGAPEAGRDLQQVRDAIDGVRALLEILERSMSDELGPLRDALSQLQMAYAREVQSSGGEPGAGGGEQGGERPQGTPAGEASQGQGEAEQPGEPGSSGPGPAESSGRLWVPGR